jgi:GNAT superfamily N-acetyltransferase
MIEQDVSAQLDPGLIELQREVLGMGHPLRVKLHGMSMYPAIRPGDVGVIRAIEWTRLRRGDIAYYEREGRLLAHRVLVPPLDADAPLVTKGDTLPNYDPPALPAQLLGRVEEIERGNRRYSLSEGRGFRLQRVAAELSRPYSALFWKVAALRRRWLRAALRYPLFRARRRKSRSDAPEMRPYRDGDLDALANCMWDLRLDLNFAQARDWTQRKVESLAEAGAALRVLHDGRRIVGAFATAERNEEFWLLELYLHPLVRGFGWGDMALAEAERRARESGAKEALCRIPADARAAAGLMTKRGWRKSPRVDFPPCEGFQRVDGATELWRIALE